MTASTSIPAARKHFDHAMALLDNDDDALGNSAAHMRFRKATEIDPSMADAWLGRITTGDDALPTLRALYACGARLHRETNRIGAALCAPVKAGPYLSISVTESSHAGLGLASALVDNRQYEKAAALLCDSSLLDGWENHQWQQHIRAYLMFATGRWPDVVSAAAAILPPRAVTMAAVTAATNALAAHAAVHLGQALVALDWTNRAELTVIDPVEFPLLAADVAYVRGMAYRLLGDQDNAGIWLSKATINGALVESAKQALADPALRLVITDEEAISTRSDKWDVGTELSDQQRQDDENDERREALLAQGRALLDNQVGLADVKQAVAELEDQIEVRALRLAAGLPVTSQTNHVLLVGPPGTGKTTTAEALGKIYAGLGIVAHPEIIEVKRADFCGEHIGASGPKTNELISRSLGRILFMDEFYSLVERHHDGRPDMIGMEAVNQLLVALETHRFDFCFIGAGYEQQVDEFLTVNPGLAGRFNRKLRFESYAPGELVEIAVRYGGPRATVIEPAARAAFNVACTTLRAYRTFDGDHGIDVMQNGRFARNIIERAERLRDSRVATQHRFDQGSVTVEDLQTLRTRDVTGAVIEACREKHVPIEL
jgi:type VII secretion ATPase EccA